MKHAIKFLSFVGLIALAFMAMAAIRDETGTTRFRQGAVLSFDTQTTVKDEDGNWTMGNTELGYLANGGSSSMAWTVSALTIGATTNQVTFAATNTTPAAADIVKWVSVRVAGDTNAYRIGLAK